MRKPANPSILSVETEADRFSEYDEVAFFFGAGASIEAGVPDTIGMVESFVQSIKSASEKNALMDFLKELNGWAKYQKPARIVDVELLLETLQRLADRDKDPLSSFVPELPDPYAVINPIIMLRLLRDFIKSKVIVDASALHYLEPLRGFAESFRPLDIYSANYDTCIEVFCAEHKLKYRDGFDESWNPKVFDDINIDLRLFKIHGSATWYRSDRGRFLKIPILAAGSTIELITRERAESLMLYPAQKFEYIEPLFELMVEMKRRLAHCRTLFVVGYSFRDEHVRRMCWDVARQNPEFHLVIVDPKARSIYESRLKTYEDNKTLSSLAGRVIFLPYPFGTIFPGLQSDFLVQLRVARECQRAQRTAEITGRRPDWSNCVLSVARCGDYEAVKRIMDKKDALTNASYSTRIECMTRSAFNAAASEDSEHKSFFINELKVLLFSAIDDVKINFNLNTNELQYSQLPTHENLSGIISTFETFGNELESKRLMMKKPSKETQNITQLLIQLAEDLVVWKKRTISYEDYLAARTGRFCPSELVEVLKKLKNDYSIVLDAHDHGESIIHEIKQAEKQAINMAFATN